MFKSSLIISFQQKHSTKPFNPRAVPAPSHPTASASISSSLMDPSKETCQETRCLPCHQHPLPSPDSAAPTAPHYTHSPPLTSLSRTQLIPGVCKDWPRHPARRMDSGRKDFVTHPNWPRGLNSRSWLCALTRFNFLIEISWKNCTFLISRPSMNALS